MTGLPSGYMVTLVLRLADEVPKDDDVTAGAWGALMFAALVVATVILLRSFLKQMRKADQAKQAGVFGDPPAPPEPADDEDHPTRQ